MNEERRRPKRRLSGCILAATAVPVLLALGGGLFILLALRVPYDAPLARMYRAETEVRALVKAIDTYHDTYQSYPPPGMEGLRMATRLLSARANYFPKGPPPDPWGHPYRYVPSDAYQAPGSEALHSEEGGYCAPGTYQVYSDGADGEPGFDGREGRDDNITSWGRLRSWRGLYRKLDRQFMKQRSVVHGA